MPTSKEELLRRGLKPHDIHHTQHRRAEWQNYGESGLYMVTLCIDGRQPLFGCLEGNIKAKRGTADNPLRALMRRQLPHLMERRLHLRIGTHEYAAFGALFLPKRAEKEQVFYHRRDKDTGIPTELTEGYKRQKERQLAEARTGVVLVSPGISTGESLVIDAAIAEGLPVIHLQKKPIERYWKPERRRFEACARGALLILSPWGLDEELMKTAPNGTGTPSDYARFHRLNDLAEEICNTTDVTLLNITTQQ